MSRIKDQASSVYKREVVLRPAKKQDAAGICRLLHELAEHEGRHCMQSEASVARELLGKAAAMQVVVAETDGEIVGLLCYYPGYDVESASYGNHLADIIVTEVWRGQGVGTLLMREAARCTLEEGRQWLSWTVLKVNRKALRFYERLGAQDIPLRFLAMGEAGLGALAES